MANDATEIRIAGSGSIHVAPTATAMPAEPEEALNVAFVDLGYVTEDGVALSPGRSIEKIRAWQSRNPVRTAVSEAELTISAALEQWNRTTMALAFGGGSFTVTTGTNYKFTPPASSDVDEKALVLEWQDDTYTYRLCAPTAVVTETDEIPLKADEAATLGITFEILGDDWFILTDDPAFAA